MRSASAKHRTSVQEKQQRIARQSDQIMKRIQQIKEQLSPSSFNPKMGSENRSKWEQYLPTDNKMHSFASVSYKDDYKIDNYRQSLENRLQRLFREEKDLLKERHFASSFGASIEQNKASQSKGFVGANNLKTSSSIQNMQRKIRQLQQKYRQQKLEKSRKQLDLKETNKDINQDTQKGRTRFYSQIRKQKQESNQQMSKQQVFEQQIIKLRRHMDELRQSNKQLTEKMLKKEEKRKHKHKTRQILLNILHKLEFINAQLSSAKKKSFKDDSITTKMQKEAVDLISQFQGLKGQYKHLEQQRKSIEKKQEQIEAKLTNFMNSK